MTILMEDVILKEQNRVFLSIVIMLFVYLLRLLFLINRKRVVPMLETKCPNHRNNLFLPLKQRVPIIGTACSYY